MPYNKENGELVSLIDGSSLSEGKAIALVYPPESAGRKFIVTNHHAGNYVPRNLMPYIIADSNELVGDSDRDTEKLYDATDMGGTGLISKINRDIVDPNRARDNLGEGGALRTRTFNGSPIYSWGNGLPPGVKEHLLSAYWDPYHAALESEISRLVEEHGTAIIFMGDSMDDLSPSFSHGDHEAAKERRPDIAVITNGGVSAGKPLVNDFFDALYSAAKGAGLGDVRMNSPWSGSGDYDFILQNYGKPGRNRHVIQMETNKRHMASGQDIQGLNALIKKAMGEAVSLHIGN